MLIPIPHEKLDPKTLQKDKNRTASTTSKKGKRKGARRDDNLIRNAKKQLNLLVSKQIECPKEIKSVIYDLQRSILALERKRLHIMKKQNKKRNK